MIGIVPMDITDDETIKDIIAHIDTILQVNYSEAFLSLPTVVR